MAKQAERDAPGLAVADERCAGSVLKAALPVAGARRS